jgi:hypothetical protein
MAKNKTKLPSIGAPKDAPKPAPKTAANITVELPMPKEEIALVERIRHDLRPLTRLQQRGLMLVTASLIESGAELENGQVIKRRSSAIKWMLEQAGK